MRVGSTLTLQAKGNSGGVGVIHGKEIARERSNISLPARKDLNSKGIKQQKEGPIPWECSRVADTTMMRVLGGRCAERMCRDDVGAAGTLDGGGLSIPS